MSNLLVFIETLNCMPAFRDPAGDIQKAAQLTTTNNLSEADVVLVLLSGRTNFTDLSVFLKDIHNRDIPFVIAMYKHTNAEASIVRLCEGVWNSEVHSRWFLQNLEKEIVEAAERAVSAEKIPAGLL